MKSYHGLSSIELLIDNLTLLGFDPRHDASDPVFHKVTIDTTMFTKPGDDHRRTFECISYFLFNKLDPIQTQSRFTTCWPIKEHSATGRAYRMAAYQWLIDLWEQRWLLGPLTLRRSIFETCPDGALTDIMVSFSVLVLQTVLDRELADPKGQPLRLLPLTLLGGNDPTVLENKLQEAIRALAHYSRQQNEAFTAWTLKAKDKARAMKQRIDLERNTVSQQNHTSLKPDLKTIRKRLIHLQQKSSNISTRKSSTALSREHLINSQYERTPSSKGHPYHFVFPSLVTPRDLDPTYDINRIHSFVQQYVDTNELS